MFNSSTPLGRLFISLITPAHVESPSSTGTPNCAAPTPHDIAVGQGADNERIVTIAGTPMLFRDEGDVIVQFQPSFDFGLRDTLVGSKLLPSLSPHWAVCAEHNCPLVEAISGAIKAANAVSIGRPASELAVVRDTEVVSSVRPQTHDIAEISEPHRRKLSDHRSDAAVVGRIVDWGEKEFPDRKRPGKTYTAFALTLRNRFGERTLQGEGLKDAITEVKCRTGENVEVMRLGKIKVPAIDDNGQPKLDSRGAQLLWDKWQWSIKRKS